MNVSHAELNAEIRLIEERMDARQENIERIAQDFDKKAEELKTEFRTAKWWALGTAVALIGVMVGLQMLTNSWEQTYLNAYSSRVDALANRMDTMNNRIDAMSNQMNSMQNTLDSVAKKLNIR